MERLYRKIPKTTCEGCDTCCNDAPIASYPEILLVMEYIIENWSNEKVLELYQKAVKGYIMGLVSKEIPCSFLEESRCSIYQGSGVSCKRWGLQGREAYEKDYQADKRCNALFKKFYAEKGISIPDEVINFRLEYCDKVRVTENKYNIMPGKELEKVLDKDMTPMAKFYGQKNSKLSISEFLAVYIIG